MGRAPGEPVSSAEARVIAYRFLGRREYSCMELGQRLEQRGVAPDVSAALIEDLVTEGLLSDSRFAEMFVRSRVGRLQGPVKIRAQLRQRGINDEIAISALSDYEDQWQEYASQWLARRAGDTLDRKEKARLYRGGISRGFTHEQIMRALDRHQRGED